MAILHICPSVMECAERLLDDLLGQMQPKNRPLTLNDVERILNHASDLHELRSLSDLLVQRIPYLDVAEVVEREYAVETVKGWAAGTGQ